VTGAGNGLGKSYAMALAARGAAVLVNDLGAGDGGDEGSHSVADAVVDEIRCVGGTAAASYDSVATPQGGHAIVQEALDCYGRVDIVVNNAGILRNRPFAEQTIEDFDLTLATHLWGGFNVTQPAYRCMQQSGYGRIVFTSSLVGAFGSNWEQPMQPLRRA
jgi:NAD(P)-dependent dehydrogenase (short-subunit alcohol dehydrogenase family)